MFITNWHVHIILASFQLQIKQPCSYDPIREIGAQRCFRRSKKGPPRWQARTWGGIFSHGLRRHGLAHVYIIMIRHWSQRYYVVSLLPFPPLTSKMRYYRLKRTFSAHCAGMTLNCSTPFVFAGLRSGIFNRIKSLYTRSWAERMTFP